MSYDYLGLYPPITTFNYSSSNRLTPLPLLSCQICDNEMDVYFSFLNEKCCHSCKLESARAWTGVWLFYVIHEEQDYILGYLAKELMLTIRNLILQENPFPPISYTEKIGTEGHTNLDTLHFNWINMGPMDHGHSWFLDDNVIELPNVENQIDDDDDFPAAPFA